MEPMQQHKIVNSTYYIHKPDHRNGTPRKSQWVISENLERLLFKTSKQKKWCDSNKGWGLYIVNGEVKYIGLAQDHKKRVFIGKFVDGNCNQIWHGYPADHQKNTQDIPPVKLLREWSDKDILRPSKIRKLAKGQPCNL